MICGNTKVPILIFFSKNKLHLVRESFAVSHYCVVYSLEGYYNLLWLKSKPL